MNRYRLALLTLLILPAAGFGTDPDAEEYVTIYSTYGVPGPNYWTIPVRIWVHEPPDLARELLARAARNELAERAGIGEPDRDQKDLFMQRVNGFIADSESREAVLFRFDGDPAGKTYRLRSADGDTTTDRNGHLVGVIALSNADADSLLAVQKERNGWLTLRVISDDHEGAGRIRLIEARGLSIVSDIDDTVKVTDIPSGEAEVLRNTFFRDFRAVPCMAELYAGYGGETAYHYVSGGPWQLYEPLSTFLFDAGTGFPEGSFHMKNVRTNPFESKSYRDIWKLVSEGSEQVTFDQKLQQIGLIMMHFPERQFILIGDSGERDPEVFAEIRRRFPEQVAEIRIRDIVDDAEARPERLRGMSIIPPHFSPQFDCSDLPRDFAP